VFEEFKKFALRGNVVDMAVGIVIGTAFGAIASSLVADIVMPPLGFLLGSVDFSELYINLSETPYESLAAAQAAGAPTVNYGVFLTRVVHFVVVAFAMFLVVKAMNRALAYGAKPAPAPAGPVAKACPECLSTIPEAARRCAYCTAPLA